ncbi:flagellar motor protein MotB [Segetibacter sp. 3557_3]|uniref:OmpA/MotB family protein n=1 Tax=Segetibacter sp. 3557_3 TaxID=2547429 RepID=UPI00105859F5|nr:flagellar motor protein MotB [Segetibacter sp. 3557_3]TDH29184.1 flagellar motor protein MotB [Segetibacter sp. 3557_3]
MTKTTLTVALLFLFSLTSCVAKKKFLQAQDTISDLRSDSANKATRINKYEQDVLGLETNIRNLERTRNGLQRQVDSINQRLDAANRDASNKLQDASSKLTLSQKQIADQQQRLEQLQELMDQQKKNREELRKKISDALVSFNSNELTVATKNGKVYVSLQENLLFPSGSAVVNQKGTQALSKLAEVLNVNPDINIEIEGHTDSIPMKGRYSDNWDLSTARSTAIVRILTNSYKVDPIRVKAAGRSKYEPVDVNSTADGRAKNRRTEIILSPKLDELMRLVQSE